MISIVTPSYNQGKYIERTLQSVLSQSIPQLEYVVIDGGSTDDTISILKRYANRLHFVSEPDRGQAHAVNKGIMMTSKEIIGWLNSDDVYYPNAIKTVLDFFATHPDVDIIYGRANHIDAEDKIINAYPTESWNEQRLKQTCFISQPAVFFRRRVIEKCGLLNESLHYCLDYEYWLRCAKNEMKFSYLEDVLAGSRLYPETKTVSAPEKAYQETLKMLKQRLGYVPAQWIIGEAISQVKNKMPLRMPALRYKLAVLAASIYSAFRWNGFVGGICACVQFLLVIIKHRKSILFD